MLTQFTFPTWVLIFHYVWISKSYPSRDFKRKLLLVLNQKHTFIHFYLSIHIHLFTQSFNINTSCGHRAMPQADYFKEMRLFWSSFVCEESHLVIEIVTAICWLTHGIQSSFPLAGGFMQSKRLAIVEKNQAVRAVSIE